MNKVFPRNSRIHRRIVYKTDGYQGGLYKRSPYYVGCNLWDSLALESIELPDIYSFKAGIKRLNRQYVDSLS